jgi:hypothetical protein
MPNAEITADDIKKCLGFSDSLQLELASFRECLLHGFSAEHGGTYDDPVTQKSRQFDVRATAVRRGFRVRLAVECKCIRDPLVVSTIPRTDKESFHELIFSYKHQNAIEDLASFGRAIRFKTGDSIYRGGAPVGKATLQVKKTPSGEFQSGDSEIFEKWAQAIASARDLVAASERDWRLNETEIAFALVIPVLVLPAGTLWRAPHDERGMLSGEPKLVDECEIYISKSINTGKNGISYTVSHLHVVTLPGLKVLLGMLTSPETISALLEEDVIAKAISNR